MDNNYVNERVFDAIEVVDKDIDAIQSELNDIENYIDQIKDLCVKLESYNNSLVDFTDLIYDFNDTSLNQMYCWQIDGYYKLSEKVDLFSNEIADVKGEIFSIKNNVSQLNVVAEESVKRVKDIEKVFDVSSTNLFNDLTNYDLNSISQDDVLKKIQNQFDVNKNLNKKFNNEVYHGVYDDLVQFVSNEMGKTHGAR